MIILLFIALVGSSVINAENEDLPTHIGPEDILEASIKDVSFSERVFSIDVYKAAVERRLGKRGNLAVSTVGLFLSLLMAYHGTSGDTRKELHDALKLSSNYDTARYGYEDLVNKIGNMKFPLDYSNSLIIGQNVSLKSTFIDVLNSTFRYQGHRQISNDNGTFVNSIGLKAASRFVMPWIGLFRHCRNSGYLKFNRPNKEPKTLKYMYQYGEVMVGEHDGHQFLELPTESNKPNGEFRTFVILPSKQGGLEDLEKSLDEEWVRVMTMSTKRQLANVIVPVFFINKVDDFTDIVKEDLHVTRLFTAGPDLAGISNTENFHFGDCKNQGFARGQEWGHNEEDCHPEEFGVQGFVEFKVDRPFMVIAVRKEEENTLIISMTRVVHPRPVHIRT